MKRYFLLVIVVLALTSCQSVIAEDVTPLPPTITTTVLEPTAIARPTTFPESYHASRSFYDGKYDVTIDAKVHYNPDTPHPIYTVEAVDFDQGMLDAVMAHFSKGQVFCDTEGKEITDWTQDYIKGQTEDAYVTLDRSRQHFSCGMRYRNSYKNAGFFTSYWLLEESLKRYHDAKIDPPTDAKTVHRHVRQGEAFLSLLSMEGYICQTIEPIKHNDTFDTYLYFAPTTNEIPMSRSHPCHAEYGYEACIQICMSDAGIVSFCWHNPIAITQCMQDVHLKSLNDVTNDLFNETQAYLDSLDWDCSIVDSKITITDIRLECQRLSRDSATYIPTWVYYGYAKDSAFDMLCTEEQIRIMSERYPLLTVSAVDNDAYALP